MEMVLKVAKFMAFNISHEKVFVNKTDEEVIDEIEKLCNTGVLFTIDTFDATLVDSKEFNELVDKGQRLNKEKSNEANNMLDETKQ